MSISLEPRITQPPSAPAAIEAQPQPTESASASLSLTASDAQPEQDLAEIYFLTARLKGVLRELNQTRKAYDAIEAQYQKRAAALNMSVIAADQFMTLLQGNDKPDFGPLQSEFEAMMAMHKLREHAKGALERIQKEAAELSDRIQILEKKKTEQCVKEFLALSGEEKRKADHFLWMAMGRPDLKTFIPNERILTATPAQIHQMTILSLAAKKLENFHTVCCQHMENFDERAGDSLRYHWDLLIDGSELEREAGVFAQKTLIKAVWLLKGCANTSGTLLPKDQINYNNTVGECEAPLFEALRRLSKYNMILLRDQTDRDVLAGLVRSFGSTIATDGFYFPVTALCKPLINEASATDTVQLLTFAFQQACGKKARTANLEGFLQFFAMKPPTYTEYFFNVIKQVHLFDTPEEGRRPERGASSASDEKQAS